MSKEPWDFTVVTKDVQVSDPTGQLIHDVRATIDDSTGELIGLVSRRYQPIQNRVIHDSILAVGDDLGLELKAVELVKGKRGTLFRHGFKTERIVNLSSRADDKVQFGLETFNSFDNRLGGSKVRAFANLLVCSNGASMPKEVGSISLKSFEGMTNPSRVKEVLENRIQPIFDTVDVWNRWAQIIPNRTKVGEFVSKHFSKKVSEALLEQYDSGKDQTIWGLYNVLTFYSSHSLKSKGSLRLKQWGVENTINKMYKIKFD